MKWNIIVEPKVQDRLLKYRRTLKDLALFGKQNLSAENFIELLGDKEVIFDWPVYLWLLGRRYRLAQSRGASLQSP